MTEPSVIRTVDYEASRLLPGYFSLVMATGIVSIAVYIYGMTIFAYFLSTFNIIAFISLWVLTLVRIIRHSSSFIADMKDADRGSGFFTIIAGTNTLGSQIVTIYHNYTAGYYIWLFGLILWFVFQYTLFTIFTVIKNKPPIEKGLNVTWLVAIVSTQSVAVLGSELSQEYPQTYIVAIIMYMIGWLMYPLIMSIVTNRLLFSQFQPDELTGPYWISMGATAITTFAGSEILLAYTSNPVQSSAQFLSTVYGFIEGATFLIWAYGTWWIPWLLIIGFWKHGIKKVPLLKYDPEFWGAVFPMGMYTVSTYMLVKVTGLRMLQFIPDYFLYIAIVSWVYEFTGLLYTLVKKLLVGSFANTSS